MQAPTITVYQASRARRQELLDEAAREQLAHQLQSPREQQPRERGRERTIHGAKFMGLSLAVLAFAIALLAGGGALATPAGPTEHGPCRIGGDEIAYKCIHYKLQEAKRVGRSERGSCLDPAILIRDGGLLYWTCGW